MVINEEKKGISLVILLITIAVALILVATITTSFGKYIETSRLSKLANEVSQIQDMVTAFYIKNDYLPVIGEAKTKSDILEMIEDTGNRYDMEKEIDLNGDNYSTTQFYTVDLDLIETEGDTEGKKYILSYPNFTVYDMDGMEVNFHVYYSISPRLSEIVKVSEGKKATKDSTTSIVKGSTLKVTSNNLGSTNKMGITVNSARATSTIMYLEFSGITEPRQVRNTISKFSFDSLDDLNNKDILATALTQDEINSFNNSISKTINVVIRNSKNEEIARETIDMSNYDASIPKVKILSNRVYNEMRVVRVELQDSGNNLKEVRYDYLKKVDVNNNVSDYYSGVKSFDNNYMLTKAKTIDMQEVNQGVVDIKVPKDVGVLCVAAVDSSGNISNIIPVSYTNGIACNITTSVVGTINTTNTTYTFVFSEDVLGFTTTDLEIINGTILNLTGSGSIYQVIVQNVANSNGTQRITLKSGMCQNADNTASNFEASLQVDVNTIKESVSPQGISLSTDNLKLKVGTTDTLFDIIAPANVSDNSLEWKSDNEEVVSVNKNGEVSAKKLGTANITVKTVNNKTATCKVDVVN